ncbi:MAG: hypothetical protein K2J42_02330 [Muribaculaceae bacterium]|nr:hypothetical protein [Muribaculaceae bacterium]
MVESTINRIIHSRSTVSGMFVLAVLSTWVAIGLDKAPVITGDTGIAVTSPDDWLASEPLSFALNMTLIGLVAVMSVLLSKTYNPMRSLSALFASFFLLFEAATPSILARFYGGTLTAVVIIAVSILLFSIFQNPDNPRRVFLAFFLLVLGSLAQYSLLLYIPMLLAGLWQMKIFNLRNVLAALLGAITPMWILMGFGMLDFSDFEVPQFTDIFTAYRTSDLAGLLFTTGITIVGGIFFFTLNFIKMLSYNSRIRAANGFLSLLMFYTMILTCVDYNNIYNYLPLLNWAVAYQAGHFFATNTARRSFVGVFIVLLVYLMIYSWNLGN